MKRYSGKLFIYIYCLLTLYGMVVSTISSNLSYMPKGDPLPDGFVGFKYYSFEECECYEEVDDSCDYVSYHINDNVSNNDDGLSDNNINLDTKSVGSSCGKSKNDQKKRRRYSGSKKYNNANQHKNKKKRFNRYNKKCIKNNRTVNVDSIADLGAARRAKLPQNITGDNLNNARNTRKRQMTLDEWLQKRNG